MMRLTGHALGIAMFAVLIESSAWGQAPPVPDAQANRPPIVRVRGTIEHVDGNTFAVRSRDGAELKVALADKARIVAVVKASLADIKQGSFVGVTGMPQADGTQRAIAVHVFAESMRGIGAGHYPWDLPSGSMITQGNVEQTVAGVEGHTLSVKYKDWRKQEGEKTIIVPADATIVSDVPGDKSELKPRTKIFISGAKKLPDGTLEAHWVDYGRDGLTPPL